MAMVTMVIRVWLPVPLQDAMVQMTCFCCPWLCEETELIMIETRLIGPSPSELLLDFFVLFPLLLLFLVRVLRRGYWSTLFLTQEASQLLK